MDSKIKISIIVPIYNGEKYLEQCLDSLLNQTYQNVEILVVNDGSTDSTDRILKKYEKRDSRIVVLNQKNQGTGMARNLGIDKATGTFLTFVDSDDYLLEECIEKVVETIEETPEVSLVNWKNETFIGDSTELPCNGSVLSTRIFETGKEYMEYLLENGGGTGGVCCKAYRTSVILEHDLRFGKYKTAEDGHFNALCLKHLSKVVNLDYTGYMYRKEDYVIHSTTKFFNRPDFFMSSVQSAAARLAVFRDAMLCFEESEERFWNMYHKSEYYTFQVVNDENAVYNPSLTNKIACNKILLTSVLSEGALASQDESRHMKRLYKLYEMKSATGLYFWNYGTKGFLKSILIYWLLGKLMPKNSKRGIFLRKMMGR